MIARTSDTQSGTCLMVYSCRRKRDNCTSRMAVITHRALISLSYSKRRLDQADSNFVRLVQLVV
jgi:hypothetical protein